MWKRSLSIWLVTSFGKLNDAKLPYKALFYSKLNNSHISNDDYNQAKTVWQKFNCKTLLDYHNVYLNSDVLLLSDIWENFRMFVIIIINWMLVIIIQHLVYLGVLC